MTAIDFDKIMTVDFDTIPDQVPQVRPGKYEMRVLSAGRKDRETKDGATFSQLVWDLQIVDPGSEEHGRKLSFSISFPKDEAKVEAWMVWVRDIVKACGGSGKTLIEAVEDCKGATVAGTVVVEPHKNGQSYSTVKNLEAA